MQKLPAWTQPQGDHQDGCIAARNRKQLADFQKMEKIRARCDALVDDPVVAAALKPWYKQFCKQPCFHDEYLQTFNLPNMHLIDTDSRDMDQITADSMMANNGTHYPLDCLIFATGFELATSFSHRARLEVYGRGGVSISQRWKDEIRSLHGWTTRGFPNCFRITMPQAAVRARRWLQTVEPTREAEEAWCDTILQTAAIQQGAASSFLEACTPGFYNNEGTPGLAIARGAPYGGGVIKFFELIRQWRGDGGLAGLELRRAE
ncbi:hypothetical protein AJ79_02280 [Helicocarpus griseus UAMH5409]|uniref:Uncharacterized protein n=1 Tax=Helicocarpus griseus UAMH5409 TaxID=1447875 RepID=A0A2B7Y2H8_9EURO|nr:hypothetical protein AJ79_02280 [Helicocarpus griseus UAMH5409]